MKKANKTNIENILNEVIKFFQPQVTVVLDSASEINADGRAYLTENIMKLSTSINSAGYMIETFAHELAHFEQYILRGKTECRWSNKNKEIVKEFRSLENKYYRQVEPLIKKLKTLF